MSKLTDEQVETVAHNLVSTFNEVKKELKIMPVKSGPVYLPHAAEMCSIGTKASEVEEVLALQRIKDRMDKINDLMERYMPYFAAIALGFGFIIGAYIVVNAFN